MLIFMRALVLLESHVTSRTIMFILYRYLTFLSAVLLGTAVPRNSYTIIVDLGRYQDTSSRLETRRLPESREVAARDGRAAQGGAAQGSRVRHGSVAGGRVHGSPAGTAVEGRRVCERGGVKRIGRGDVAQVRYVPHQDQHAPTSFLIGDAGAPVNESLVFELARSHSVVATLPVAPLA